MSDESIKTNGTPETGSTIPPKGLGRLQWKDLLKGIYYAAAGQVVFLVGYLFNSIMQETPHFPTWPEWLPYLKAIGLAIGGYLIGKLGVNNVGQIWKKDKPIVHVDARELDAMRAELNK